jgi:hypothetical protein
MIEVRGLTLYQKFSIMVVLYYEKGVYHGLRKEY